MYRPELVVGLIGALGADLDTIYGHVAESLGRFGFTSEPISLDGAVQGPGGPGGGAWLESALDRADALRAKEGAGAVAALGIAEVRRLRKGATGSGEMPRGGHAYVMMTVRDPAEVELLRKTFGERLLLISARMSEGQLAALVARLGPRAEALVRRDRRAGGTEGGYDLDAAFKMGDYFVPPADGVEARPHVDRFIRLVFGDTSIRPTADEYGMFHAAASSERSTSPSGRAGAAILDRDGAVVATGAAKAAGNCECGEGDREQRA